MEGYMTLDEFYKNFWKFREFRSNLPVVNLITSYNDMPKKSEGLIKVLKRVGRNNTVLDVGAGDMILKKYLLEAGFKGIYKSMDLETTHTHDFSTLEDISGKYDCVFMFEIIEHLTLESCLKYLTKAHEVLNNAGRLFLSTPNIDHINALWRSNITHIRQYPIRDLYALLRLMNFNGKIDLYRVYRRPYRFKLKSKIREILRIFISKILGVDYAGDIMIIAEK